MAQMGFIDDLVKEYLIFRGFGGTLKSFENDLKWEKEKGQRADRIVETILIHIGNQDLTALRDLWSHLNTRIFSRLADPNKIIAVNKFENSLLKLYLINCIQTKHPEKVKDFFEKLSSELQGASDWKDWFPLPFIKNPEENAVFAHYFSRQWQDTLISSIYNFLAIVYSCLPPPRLAEYQNTSVKMRKLREDNDSMRQKLMALMKHEGGGSSGDGNGRPKYPDVPPPSSDVMDDFFIIAQESGSSNMSTTPSSDSQMKNLKSFLKNLTTSSSEKKAAAAAAANLPTSKLSPSPRQPSTSSRSGSTKSQQHIPVRRVSQITSSIGSNNSTNASNSASILPPDHPAVTAAPPPPAAPVSLSNNDSTFQQATATNNQSTGRLAYLLLGQEEFSEHQSEITHCRFSSSGNFIASSDIDGIIKIWSPTPAPKTLATFISISGVTAMDWVTHSERHFIYGTKSGTIRLCDKNDRTSVEFESSSSISAPIIHITSNPNGSSFAVSTTVDMHGLGSLFMYDLKTSKMERDLSLGVPIPMISCSVFNHNSQMIVVGGVDGKVRIFDLRRKDCISSWSTHDCTPITTLQMANDENSVYAMTSDGHISNWSMVQTGTKMSEQMLDDPYFNESVYPRSAWGKQFAFTNDGKHLLSCSISGGIIYENSSANLVKVLGLKGHKSHATCVDWSTTNDCGPCVTADSNGHIRVSTLLSQ